MECCVWLFIVIWPWHIGDNSYLENKRLCKCFTGHPALLWIVCTSLGQFKMAVKTDQYWPKLTNIWINTSWFLDLHEIILVLHFKLCINDDYVSRFLVISYTTYIWSIFKINCTDITGAWQKFLNNFPRFWEIFLDWCFHEWNGQFNI